MHTVPDKRLNYYRQTPDDVIAELGSHRMGLTKPESARRLEQLGSNRLQQISHPSPVRDFLRQATQASVWLPLLAAILACCIRDGKLAITLFTITLLSAAAHFAREHRVDSPLHDLAQLVPPRAAVLRNGNIERIPTDQLVLGDIIYIQETDAVPADVRLLDVNGSFATNDRALTGEPEPSRKYVHAISDDVPLPLRHNLAFMGTTVARGSAHGIVIATGMHTELGRIASLNATVRADASPLSQELRHVDKRLTVVAVILAIVLVVVAWWAGLSLHAVLLAAIGLSVALAPNGLPAAMVALVAQVASRLAATSTMLFKRLSAIETLGATNILLVDKTGVLTTGELAVSHLLVGRSPYTVSGHGYEPAGRIVADKQRLAGRKIADELSLFFTAGVLSGSATVHPPDARHRRWYTVGNPAEGALITLARKAGLRTETVAANTETIADFPFDAARRLTGTVRRHNGQLSAFIQGAPAAVLDHSVRLWDHGHVRKLTGADRSFFADFVIREAAAGRQTIALAYRLLPNQTEPAAIDQETAETALVFLGIASLTDPLQGDVADQLAIARRAHVSVSVMTSDTPAIAAAVAVQAQLGTADQPAAVVTGDELRNLADSQLAGFLERGGVIFAGTTPEDKLRLSEIAKQSGRLVAVTGDNLSDIPALSRADIGLALVSTPLVANASDIVLSDQRLETLIDGIRRGRLVFRHIHQAARCALTDNAAELIIILLSLAGQALFHVPAALTVVQIVALDLILQFLPIFALSRDKAGSDLLHGQPRRLRNHFLTPESSREFILFGLLAACLAYANFLGFFIRHDVSAAYIGGELYLHATILTCATLLFCQYINLMLVRSDAHRKLFTSYLWRNKRLLVAIGVSLFCLANIVYNPFFQSYFDAGPLSPGDWLSALVAAGLYLSARLLQRHTRQHTRAALLSKHRPELIWKHLQARLKVS